jgi:hypothetical protein
MGTVPQPLKIFICSNLTAKSRHNPLFQGRCHLDRSGEVSFAGCGSVPLLELFHYTKTRCNTFIAAGLKYNPPLLDNAVTHHAVDHTVGAGFF